jgi:hypothetical protein
MEQLWYTSCKSGIQHRNGVGVRAASAELSNVASPTYRRLQPYLKYNLPKGASPVRTLPEHAPVSLAFVHLEREKYLIHKAYVGLDFTGQRHGNFFSHLIGGIPANWTLREAINLWGSPVWAKDDQSIGSSTYELPSIEADDEKLGTSHFDPGSSFDPKLREALAFVIEAYLTLLAADPSQRLYIAAPSGVVATLLWGLGQSLPRGLLRDATFTTFTDDPTPSPTLPRIVGVSWGDVQGQPGTPIVADLPPACYRGAGFGINTYMDNKKSLDLPSKNGVKEFAQFAVRSLGNTDGVLNQLVNAAERSKVDDIDELLLFYRLKSKSITEFSQEDLRVLLRSEHLYHLACDLLKERAVQNTLIQVAITDTETWNLKWDPILSSFQKWALRANDRWPTLTLVSQAAGIKVVQYLRSHNFQFGVLLFDRIAEPWAASPTQVYLHLFRELTPMVRERSLQPDARIWMLKRANKLFAENLEQNDRAGIDAYIMEWLRPTWQEAWQLLGSELPFDWRVQIAESLVKLPAQDGPACATIVEKYHSEFGAAIENLGREHPSRRTVQSFIAQVVCYTQRNKYSLVAHALPVVSDDVVLTGAIVTDARLSMDDLRLLLQQNSQHLSESTLASLVARYCSALQSWTAQAWLLEYSQLASMALESPEVREQLFREVVENTVWWQQKRRTAQVPPAHLFGGIAPKSPISENLIRHAIKQTIILLRNDQPQKAGYFWDEFVRILAPGDTAYVDMLLELVHGLPLPSTFSSSDGRKREWERQAWVLQRAGYGWQRLPEQRGEIERALSSWLQIPAWALNDCLKLQGEIPDNWKVTALSDAIQSGNLRDEAPELVARYSQLVEEALLLLLERRSARSAVLDFVSYGLGRSTPHAKELLLTIVQHPAARNDFDSIFQRANVSPDDMAWLLERAPTVFLVELERRKTIIDSARKYLHGINEKRLFDPTVKDIVNRLANYPIESIKQNDLGLFPSLKFLIEEAKLWQLVSKFQTLPSEQDLRNLSEMLRNIGYGDIEPAKQRDTVLRLVAAQHTGYPTLEKLLKAVGTGSPNRIPEYFQLMLESGIHDTERLLDYVCVAWESKPYSELDESIRRECRKVLDEHWGRFPGLQANVDIAYADWSKRNSSQAGYNRWKEQMTKRIDQHSGSRNFWSVTTNFLPGLFGTKGTEKGTNRNTRIDPLTTKLEDQVQSIQPPTPTHTASQYPENRAPRPEPPLSPQQPRTFWLYRVKTDFLRVRTIRFEWKGDGPLDYSVLDLWGQILDDNESLIKDDYVLIQISKESDNDVAESTREYIVSQVPKQSLVRWRNKRFDVLRVSDSEQLKDQVERRLGKSGRYYTDRKPPFGSQTILPWQTGDIVLIQVEDNRQFTL